MVITMNENGTKKREWVKNAAIVFLLILLLLTFFSNTIQNYSHAPDLGRDGTVLHILGCHLGQGIILNRIREKR